MPTETWRNVGNLPSAQANLSSVAISGNGSVIVSSSPGGSFSDSIVRICRRVSNEEWVPDRPVPNRADTEIRKQKGTNFGQSISINYSGTVIAVGDPWLNNIGAVYIYKYNEITKKWLETKIIHGINIGDYFGNSISLNYDGTKIAIGAICGESTTQPDPQDVGSVTVYEFNNNTNDWVIYGELVGNGYGFSDSISLNDAGNIVAISQQALVTEKGSGRVRFHEYVNGSWFYKDECDIYGTMNFDSNNNPITSVATGINDKFGSSISMSSNGLYIAIGAPANTIRNKDYPYSPIDNSKQNTGMVAVYSRSSIFAPWYKRGPPIRGKNDRDGAGRSVSINSDGTIVAIGYESARYVDIYQWHEGNWILKGPRITYMEGNENVCVSLTASGNTVACCIIYGLNSFPRIYNYYSKPQPILHQLYSGLRPSVYGQRCSLMGYYLEDTISIKVGSYYDNYRDAEIKSIRNLGVETGGKGNTYHIDFICPPALKNGPGPEDYLLGSDRYPYYVIIYTKDGGVSGINTTYGKLKYFLPPVIETISVNAGSTKGGTSITITGKRLNNLMNAFFNNRGVGLSIWSDESVSFESPPSPLLQEGEGEVNLYVVALNEGYFTESNSVKFRYSFPPKVTSISPTSGPITGNTNVTIVGSYFNGATSVKFGGVDASINSISQDGTSISCTTLPNSKGFKDIVVYTPIGESNNDIKYRCQPLPTLDRISPIAGHTSGGTTINLYGSDFHNTSAVLFGNKSASNITVDEAGEKITCNLPSEDADSLKNITITTPGGNSNNNTVNYRYQQQPIITSISPVSGPQNGRTVTIIGERLYNTNFVKFGGKTATNIMVNETGTILTCITPNNTGGNVDIHVNTPGGDITNYQIYRYYNTMPIVTTITPGVGSILGGTNIVITGTDLSDVISVKFGTVDCSASVNEIGTEISCISPANSEGDVNIIITTIDDNFDTSLQYKYIPKPSISSVLPNIGPLNGGNNVIISGSNFYGISSIYFGDASSTSFRVNYNNTEITCTVPTSTTYSSKNIYLVNPAGTSTESISYKYQQLPVLTRIRPNEGPINGNNQVKLEGSFFISPAVVKFGDEYATNIRVNNNSEIICYAPASTTSGNKNVIINTPGGDSTNDIKYMYHPFPTTIAISPYAGPVYGGTFVTITGTNFLIGSTDVIFGENYATDVVVNEDGTTITCSAPSNIKGNTPVVVNTPGGTATNTLMYNYQNTPSALNVSPNAGTINGGTFVVIQGEDLYNASSVTFGGVNATIISVDPSGTYIHCTSPSGDGLQNIVINTPGGSCSIPFRYQPVPVVLGVSPNAGSTYGNITVMIEGNNLYNANSVTFGGVGSSNITVNEDGTQIQCKIPPGIDGTKDVIVNTPGGNSNNSIIKYRYQSNPTITSISPIAGKISGDTLVTITGTNLYNTIGVTFGTSYASRVNVIDNATTGNTVTCYTPIGGVTGNVQIILSTPGGYSSDNFTYRYQDTPSVTSISQNEGPNIGGMRVAISGTELYNTTRVTFGGADASDISGNETGTIIYCTTPPGSGYNRPISVTTLAGTLNSDITYSYYPLPTITNILSDGVNRKIKITGTNFIIGKTTVKVGQVNISNVIVQDSSSISCILPIIIGEYDIVITTPGGISNVYNFSTNYWSQLGLGIFGERKSDYSGHSVSLNANGDMVAIGSIYNDGRFGRDSGHVRVYKWNDASNVWRQFGQDIDGAALEDYSGYSVSLNATGYTLAVGAINNDGANGTDSGNVTVYKWNNSTNSWVKLGEVIDGEKLYDQSGYSISLNAIGNIVAIGSPYNDNDALGKTESGQARVYKWVDASNAWVKLGQSIYGEFTNDYFGSYVSLNADGNVLAVGAPGYDTSSGEDCGSTTIYKWVEANNTWEKRGETIHGNESYNGFSYSLSLSADGNSIAIGAPDSNGPAGTESGSAVVYKWNDSNNSWRQLGGTIYGNKINGHSGYSVSLNGYGNILAIGEYDPNPSNYGTVNIYKWIESISEWIVWGKNITSAEISNRFGYSVSLNYDGNNIAIGAIDSKFSSSITYTGSVGVYRLIDYFTPSVYSINPSEGSENGNATVTINGNNFIPNQTTVTIGGLNATNVTVNGTGTIITCNTPAGSETKSVVVNTSGGSSTNNILYNYIPVPLILNIEPKFSPENVSRLVTITGNNFIPDKTTVKFGAFDASNIRVNSDGTIITCYSPKSSVGEVNVVVTISGITSNSIKYTYCFFPIVNSVNPSAGPIRGNDSVVISGTGFVSGETSVRFENGLAANVMVSSDGKSINCSTPDINFNGDAKIKITTPGGDSITNVKYKYCPVPTVVTVVKNYGSITGNEAVVINGTGFISGASQVKFGNFDASGVIVDASGTIIRCYTPSSSSAQDVNVAVSTPGGNSSSIVSYKYYPIPIVSSISNDAGPTDGNTRIIINGIGFVSGISTVKFGTRDATNISVDASGTIITCDTPSNNAGDVNVVVSTPGGNSSNIITYKYCGLPTFSFISPNSGTLDGQTEVTINGTGFISGKTNVDIGGVSATNVRVTGTTQIKCLTPRNSVGVKNILINTPGGDGSNNNVTYRYQNFPVVSSITPNVGPFSNRTQVVITGENFTGTTKVTIGGIDVSNISVEGDTRIECLTPIFTNSANFVESKVVVRTSIGDSINNINFKYCPIPIVSSISKNSGPAAGNTRIIINGSGFISGMTTVKFGNLDASGVTVDASGTIITCDTPSNNAGDVRVTVITPGGNSSSNIINYKYCPIPIVSSISKDAGPTAGNTTITINGSGFISGLTIVKFGNIDASGVTVDATGKIITCYTPSNNAGDVRVTVITPGGNSNNIINYKYCPIPIVSSISNDAGPTAGNTRITIDGSGFISGMTTVKFGTLDASGVTVNEIGTIITCDTPSNNVGDVLVVVVTPGGNSNNSINYKYCGIPTFSLISPNTGHIDGNTEVTITGNNFISGKTNVTIDGISATNIRFVSLTEIKCLTPSNSVGIKNIVVSTPGGDDTNTLVTYRYQIFPLVSSISPNFGAFLTETNIVINGENFTGTTKVTIGGIDATNIVVRDDKIIECTTPSFTTLNSNKEQQVIVKTSIGNSNNNISYTCCPIPEVTKIEQNAGPIAGNETIIITGKSFIPELTTVLFEGTPATIIDIDETGTIITCTNPPSNAGDASVVVVTPGGDSSSDIITFTYCPIPEVYSLDINVGSVSGGEAITINGEGFISGKTTVMFGTKYALNVSVNSNNTLLCYTDSDDSGDVTVKVITPGGESVEIINYTYYLVPIVSTINITEGSVNGNEEIIITGDNFVFGMTTIKFGTEEVTQFTVDSIDKITCKTPANVSGDVQIIVVTPGGTSFNNSNIIIYTYYDLPTFTSISPNIGSPTGNTLVTITGTNFISGKTTVVIGGIAADNVNVINDAVIECYPSSNTDPNIIDTNLDIILFTPGGTTTNTSLTYTYVLLPVISTITPNYGAFLSENKITITGENLSGVTNVTIGEVDASSVVVKNSTTVECFTPKFSINSTGIVEKNVILISAIGNSNSSVYNCCPIPIVEKIELNAGSVNGNDTVIITGSGFIPPDATTQLTFVSFGGAPSPTDIDVNETGTRIICITSAYSEGDVRVVVTTPGGNSSNNIINYTYCPVPSVRTINKLFGPSNVTTSITLDGDGFISGKTSVLFGGVNASNIIVTPDGKKIICNTPINAIGGDVSVVVVTPGGDSSIDIITFTYCPIPSVLRIEDNAGPIAGNRTVKIYGTGFVNRFTNVKFGVNDASINSIDANGTTLTCISPSSTAIADVRVVVTTPGGNTSSNIINYKYCAKPTITSITPNRGPDFGNTLVTLVGTNFITGKTSVSFGGVDASMSSVTTTQITCYTRASSSAGLKSVVLTTPGGDASSNLITYTYLPNPLVESISPDAGPYTGSTQVTITGKNFAGVGLPKITIGGIIATGVQFINETTIKCITPKYSTSGDVDVIVTTSGVNVSNNNIKFKYCFQPIIVSISPSSGPISGNTVVNASGNFFVPGKTQVTLTDSIYGNIDVTDITINSSGTLITCKTKPGSGIKRFFVTTPGGSVTKYLPYSYYSVPTITSITPSSGSSNGLNTVTITGTNLCAISYVNFGGSVNANYITNVTTDATKITCVVPAGNGNNRVTVATLGGTSIDDVKYLYSLPPTLTSVIPNRGPNYGNTLVTIQGTNFISGQTKVKFGTVDASGVNVISSTNLTCYSPLGTSSQIVYVTTSAGTTSATTIKFTYYTFPVIGSVSPSSGSQVGGTLVTITGFDFISGTTKGIVYFNTTIATIISITNTQIVCKSPKGTLGSWNITVKTLNGTSNNFVYNYL